MNAVLFLLSLSIQAYYYSAIVEDVLLRFSWILTISLSTLLESDNIADILATVLAPLEVFRYSKFVYFLTFSNFAILFFLVLLLSSCRLLMWSQVRNKCCSPPFKSVRNTARRKLNESMFVLPRRFVWNFFRLENEHLNNCGEFRAVRDISVAPLNADDQTLLEQMMDQEDGVRNRQGKKHWKRSYSMSLRRPRLASQ